MISALHTLSDFYSRVFPLQSLFIEGKSLYRKLNVQIRHPLEDPVGPEIKEKYKAFFEKVGLRDDVVLAESSAIGMHFLLGMALGTNFLKRRVALIIVHHGLYKKDPDAAGFIVLHEAAHILHNDNLIPKIVGFAASLFGTALINCIPLSSLLLKIGRNGLQTRLSWIGETVYSQYTERKADDFMITHATDGELKAARRMFFIRVQQKKPWSWTHPSSQSRLEKVEAALKKRGIEFDIEEERVKTQELASFLRFGR